MPSASFWFVFLFFSDFVSENNLNEWILTPASIYIFPRKDNSIFSASLATLSFLRENNFDFNEWISNGVGWISPADEATRRSSINARRKELIHMKDSAALSRNNNNTNIDSGLQPTDDVDRALIENLRSEIKSWLAKGARDIFNFPVESAFQRLLLHAVVHREFPLLFSHSTRQGDKRFLSIYASQSEVFDAQLRTLDQEEELLEIQLGVRSLLDTISKEKKLIVGHNCFYDIMHMQQSFYEPLPSVVSDFKRLWTSRFPALLDTKHLAEFHECLTPLDPPATLRALTEFMALHKFVRKTSGSTPVTFQVETLDNTEWVLPSFLHNPEALGANGNDIINRARATEVDMSHEAGYDAMMTASLLVLQLDRIFNSRQINWDHVHFKLVESNDNKKKESAPLLDSNPLNIQKIAIEHLLPTATNRVRLVRTQPPVLNLEGRDEQAPSRHFLMQNFPTSWRKWEIMKVWSPIWVNVNWIRPGVCWIIAPSDEAAGQMKIIYETMDKKFDLLTYEEYKSNSELSSSIDPPTLTNS